MPTTRAILILICATVVEAVVDIKVGVMLIDDLRVPYSVQRVGPAVDLALETVNRELLNDTYHLVKVLRIYDNVCDARYASGVASDLYHKENVVAFVGPACAYGLKAVGLMAGYWHIPIVTGLGDGGDFKNKTEFPTLTRFAYCQCRLRKVFAAVFQQFGWTDIVVIYDLDDSYSDILGETLQDGLRSSNFFPVMIRFYSSAKGNYQDVLQEASLSARVIVMVVPGDVLRQFMITAHALGYPQSGDYIFMDVELFDFPGRYWGDHHWQRGDQYDEIAREAYEALLRVALYQSYGQEWTHFSEAVVLRAEKFFNFSFGSEQVNFFVGAFYDAVMRYGLALNQTMSAGLDITDGLTLTRKMWNLTLQGVTGDVIIDDNGDRDTNFAILDMNVSSGEFQLVATYWGARPGFTPVTGKSIHWPGPLGLPPANQPRCGFTGDDPACQLPEEIPTYQVALMTTLGIISFMVIVMFIGYRRLLWERDLRNMSWRIQFADVTFVQARADSFKLSKSEVQILRCNSESVLSKCKENGTEEKGLSFSAVAIYQGVRVAVKKLPEETIPPTRQFLREIKMVRDLQHDNLTRFIGVCLEPNYNYLLTEYCSKGSLQDILLNDSIKLDWTFRLSLLTDIAKAIRFLHGSPIQQHGGLRSTSCMVDSRFNLKVSDFGLPSFNRLTVATGQEDNYHANLEKLLWVAPEHLASDGAGFRQTGGSQKGDAYSFGIILEEVTLRSLPYDTFRGILSVTDILEKVLKREKPPHRPSVPRSEAPEYLFKLMHDCWDDVSEVRPTFDVILRSLKALTQGRDVNLVDVLITRMEDYAKNLEDIVAERTQELMEEKKNSEMLLYQILPKSVAEQLKRGQAVTPESYDSVSIYFSDIVGFTAMSASSQPMQVVTFLNDLYSMFDSVIEDHDVYKVETIGDAYMVVSGLPERNGDQHVLQICRMALSLLRGCNNFHIRHRPDQKLQLRVGIHSGPCCAGVVGKTMPRYCLFGDTVNTASRMESTGEPLMIHLSEKSKTLLDRMGHFLTQCRGRVELKGKGSQITYWLLAENTADNSDDLCH